MPNLFDRLGLPNELRERLDRLSGDFVRHCDCNDCDRQRLNSLRDPSIPSVLFEEASRLLERESMLGRSPVPSWDESAARRQAAAYTYSYDVNGEYRDTSPAPSLADIFDTPTDQNGNFQPNASMPRIPSLAASILEAATRLSPAPQPVATPALESVPVAERTPEKTITRLHAFRQQCETVLDGKQKRRDPDYRILVEIIWETGNPERVKFQWVQTPRTGIVEDANRDTFCFVNPLTGDIFTPAGYSRRCSATPSANVYDTISAQRITTNGITLA